ncbi:Uncharacterised protein [uncultured archaeon]|nr:Uncharacterised protein [uncultured archaeon]
MKKWFSIFVLVNFINFASAQGTISDLLNSIDEATIVLYSVFIISFTLLFFSLNRVFKDNKTTSGIISVAISLLIVYGINKSGFDVRGLFYNIGVPQETFATIIPIILIGGLIFLIIKLKKDSLAVLSGLLITTSFFVFEQTLLLATGVIVGVIWALMKFGKKKEKKEK